MKIDKGNKKLRRRPSRKAFNVVRRLFDFRLDDVDMLKVSSLAHELSFKNKQIFFIKFLF